MQSNATTPPTFTEVVFCADFEMIEPLQVAVASAIENTPGPLRIYLGRDVESESLVPWVKGVASAARGGRNNLELRDLPLPLDRFRHFKSLHGNWMAYARLALPEGLPDVERVIYLDADLIVRADLAELFVHDLEDNILGAVPRKTLRHSMEQDVWRRLSLDLDAPYFNSGVLVMDLEKMRQEFIVAQFDEYFRKVSDCFTLHDQTALNAACFGRWSVLSYEWNVPAWPGDGLSAINHSKILHYVGSPKPWDLFGRVLNPQGIHWFKVRDRFRGQLRTRNRWRTLPRRLVRTSRLARSYYRAWQKRVGLRRR